MPIPLGAMPLSLGIDTGGTCTDAVLVDETQQLVRTAKALTSHGELRLGLADAVGQVLAGVDPECVKLVSLSTTLATNALVEGRGRSVGLVLIGFSEDWLLRARLGEALGADPVLFIEGGHDAAGHALSPLDHAQLLAQATPVASKVEAWAVSSVFAVRNPEHELQAAAALAGICGQPVSLGHRLTAGLDAPRRALTALLNARLIPALVELLDAAESLLDDEGVRAPLMVVKGDGTLVSAGVARQLPVETILSGPAASVIAARVLSDVDAAVVVDIGGTTSDIALLQNGRPRLDPQGAQVGGWRTMVQAVEVISIGLGGDSELGLDDDGALKVGPSRTIPLSLLAVREPKVCDVLARQLERGWVTSHDGQFVEAVERRGQQPGSAQQRDLLERIGGGVVSLESLFCEGTEALAMARLETAGFVRRSGFTPSDACHVLGQQDTWDTRAAQLGAQLFVRTTQNTGGRLAKNLAINEASKATEQLAVAVKHAVEIATAAAVARSALGLDPATSRRDAERATWLDELLSETASKQGNAGSGAPELAVIPTLQVPLIGLGASAYLYHPGAAQRLGSRSIVPEAAGVANALGAVAGVVRQARVISLQPGGGTDVVVLLPDGPKQLPDLESAAALATQQASDMAIRAALEAGADDPPELSVSRDDKLIEKEGLSVFIESQITAVATGRPRAWQ